MRYYLRWYESSAPGEPKMMNGLEAAKEAVRGRFPDADFEERPTLEHTGLAVTSARTTVKATSDGKLIADISMFD